MTEPGAGSDLAGIKTRAEDKGDHWLLNGSKTYISNGQIGDLFIVVARTDPERRHGLGLFLVERGMEGFKRGRNLKKMGLKAQDTSELFFNDVKVPKSNVLGEPGKGFHFLTHFLAEERLITACGAMTLCQVAFDATLQFVKERKAFGQPIGTFQVSRFKMADMRAQIDAMQCFVDQCVLEHNAGRLDAVTAAEAKLLTTRTRRPRRRRQCVQLHGGAGYMDEYPISRMYTGARISRILAGSNEIMHEIIGRSLELDDRKRALVLGSRTGISQRVQHIRAAAPSFHRSDRPGTSAGILTGSGTLHTSMRPARYLVPLVAGGCGAPRSGR